MYMCHILNYILFKLCIKASHLCRAISNTRKYTTSSGKGGLLPLKSVC